MTIATTGLLRPRFFERQQLTATDLTLGIDYTRARLRRHNRFLHGWGAVCGGVVASSSGSWQVQVGEGFVVTPQGDEVYIPAGAAVYDIQVEARACLDLELPCAEPENLDDARVVKVLRGNIDPLGTDIRGPEADYNREWLQIKVLHAANLNGFVVQHTINPGTAGAQFATYYTFRENTTFPAGTIIRMHSGAAADHVAPASEIEHRYVATAGERGNWRLNNPTDTVRVLDAQGQEIDRRILARTLVYLAVYPDEVNTCPQPAVPERCQPVGGNYQFSRTREGYRFALLCELPPSHADEITCATLDNIVCGNAIAPCPPSLTNEDNGVVLAAINVSDEGIVAVDNTSVRRQLLSEALLQAHLRCRCEATPPPGQITAITPAQVTLAGEPVTLSATIDGAGLAGATQVLFSSNELQAQVTNNQSANQLQIVLTIGDQAGAEQYPFLIVFPDERVALNSAAFNVGLTVQIVAPPTIFTSSTIFTQFTSPTIFTQFTSPTIFTQFTSPSTFTQFTSPSTFTLSTLPSTFTLPGGATFSQPPVVLDPGIFDLARGRNEAVNVLSGVGDVRMNQLNAAGINNLSDLAVAPVEQIIQTLGISAVRAASLQDAARDRIRRSG